MTPRGPDIGTVKFEIPRRACPGYLTPLLGDRTGEQGKVAADEIPPGHRFLLYFHAMADRGFAQYGRKREKHKRDALNRAKDEADWPKLRALGARIDPTHVWVPLKDGTRQALEAVEGMGGMAEEFLKHWNQRADAVLQDGGWVHEAELIAPLVTGTGNPHPVENGFAFLSPYGVPYIAGSGVKGVLRRAAEELALFEPNSPWTISLVWAIFGFDENSAWYRRGDADAAWCEPYETWVRKDLSNDEVLALWVDTVRRQAPEAFRELAAPDFLAELRRSEALRRSLHWQGLVCFWDAVPQPGARLEVDILNPHHRTYYLQGQGATPHDAENPVPVYFLALEPGARFTFRAQLLSGRSALARAVERAGWQGLLDEAFQKACDELGFGAKGTLGYGHMETDPRARKRWQEEREEACRAEEASRYPWRAHLVELRQAHDWGTFRQIVENRLMEHLAEDEVAEAIDRKANELAAKKWGPERDERVAGWLAPSGRTWKSRTKKTGGEELDPVTIEAIRRIQSLKDWGDWQASGMSLDAIPRRALREVRSKFVEWGCDNRKAKKDKRDAWKKLQTLLKT